MGLGHGTQAEVPLADLEHLVGRRHIDVIGAHGLVVLRDQDRHARIPREDFRQHAFPLRGEVGDNDKGHAGLGRHGLEQILERFDASCGGTYANNGKGLIHRLPLRKGETSAWGGWLARSYAKRAVIQSAFAGPAT